MNDLYFPKIRYHKVTDRRKISRVHSHTDYELYYLISGRTAYFVEDKVFHLSAGDFIMIKKDVIHGTDSESCTHNERLLITFYDEFVDEFIFPYVQKLCEDNIIHIPDNKKYIIEEILQKVQSIEDMTDPLLKVYLYELMLLLYKHRDNNTECIDLFVSDICEYIRENYASDLSLSTLSDRFCMSEGALSRKFKTVAGLGISEYITQVRIFNAARILCKDGMSVTRAAELCGFSDSNYFSTVFKRIMKTTPLKYKKSRA